MDYPNGIPLEEIKTIIDLVRNGKVGDQLPLFAKNVWVVQGYAQKVALGEPTSEFTLVPQTVNRCVAGGAAVNACSNVATNTALEELEKFALSAESGNVSTQSVVPWELILRWLLGYLLDKIGK